MTTIQGWGADPCPKRPLRPEPPWDTTLRAGVTGSPRARRSGQVTRSQPLGQAVRVGTQGSHETDTKSPPPMGPPFWNEDGWVQGNLFWSACGTAIRDLAVTLPVCVFSLQPGVAVRPWAQGLSSPHLNDSGTSLMPEGWHVPPRPQRAARPWLSTSNVAGSWYPRSVLTAPNANNASETYGWRDKSDHLQGAWTQTAPGQGLMADLG